MNLKMGKFSLVIIYVATFLAYAGNSNSSTTPELYFIDAHSQVDSREVLNKIPGLMDQAGVKKTILCARRQLQSTDIADFAASNSDKIIPAIRTKGGAYSENRNGFYKKLDDDVQSGRFNGICELLLYHAAKGNKADEYIVYPSDKRVQAALKHAQKQKWPLVLHIEFAALEGKQRQRFMQELEELLKNNRKHPVALIHMGQLGSADVQRLIKAHKNIYFLTSHSNPASIAESDQPWTAMFSGNVLSPVWRELVIKYPERFILAFDNVWPEHWGDFYLAEANYWRTALEDLPAPVAKAVAHGNAERLWRLAAR